MLQSTSLGRRSVSLFGHSLLLVFSCSAVFGQTVKSESPPISSEKAVAVGVEQLIKIQDDDGAWPYEGVYRVNRRIPVGYRIGGTAICCEALLYATTNDHAAANRAIERGVELIFKELEHPLMKPSQENRYDVRVWGHIYALDLFCRLKKSGRFPQLEKKIESWIPKLTEAVLFEELETGGWNYANRRAHAAFVSVTAVQSLLWAHAEGQKIDHAVFERAAQAIARSGNTAGAYAYSGDERPARTTKMPGSIARSAACEFTLQLLGLDRSEPIQKSVDAFHEHWNELEQRRKKTGTHKPPYGVAPYYFYYGHRYVAQAISGLPEKGREREIQKFNVVLMKTRDQDGTWNDRVFARSRAYGTAMSMMALLGDRVDLPPRYNSEKPLLADPGKQIR